MFAEPTIEDFVARIDWHVSNALNRAHKSVGQIRSEAAAKGWLQSGRRYLVSIEAVRKEFEVGIETVLGELKRALRDTELDKHVLRETAEQHLMKFAEDAKEAARVTDIAGFDGHVKGFEELDRYLRFALRQFDVGFSDPPEPEVPPVTKNTINVNNMAGNIQQNSPGATQTFEFKLNVAAAHAALQTFKSELSKNEIDDRVRQDLAADIATIKAQLSKPSPSVPILHETGKSVRNVVEGAVAGVLTHPLRTTCASERREGCFFVRHSLYLFCNYILTNSQQ